MIFSDTPVVVSTEIPGLPRHATGKVRDVYLVGPDAVLLVATDRLSAFDVVMRQGIPGKGRVLTQISAFWFDKMRDVIPNHLLTVDDEEITARLQAVGVTLTDELRAILAGRAMLCRRTQPLPIEAVVRGYLSGSGWRAYREAAKTASEEVDLWGVEVPAGLLESSRLPAPIFTPSTKAAQGHDEPMPQSEIAQYIGEWAEPVRVAALALYTAAAAYAEEKGIILADTKFEFGTVTGENGEPQLLLIDEALTPDSSRFWEASHYAPGSSQASFDKQFVRDFLETVPGWNKQAPPPDLPPEIVAKTAEKYRDAYQRITGSEL